MGPTRLRRSRGAAVPRPSGSRRAAALTAPVLAALLLAGCGGGPTTVLSAGSTSVGPTARTTSAPAQPGGGTDGQADGGAQGTTSAAAQPTEDGPVDETDGRGRGTTSAPARPTVGGTVGEPSDEPAPGGSAPVGPEPGGGGSGGGGSGDGGSGDGGSGDDVPDGGTEGLPGWPIESTPVHGAQLWAAYVAVGAPGDPALQQALAEVQQLWPGAGLGELSCDAGAADALGRDGSEHAVAVYFPTEQHVTEFRRRWDGPYVGAVRVTTYCAD